MALRTLFFDVSWISPPIRNSSRMKYAFSKLKMMSSSHTCIDSDQCSQVTSTTLTDVDQRNLTHAAKVFIQKLHKTVDHLQSDQLIVLLLYCTAEIQAGIPAGKHTKICSFCWTGNLWFLLWKLDSFSYASSALWLWKLLLVFMWRYRQNDFCLLLHMQRRRRVWFLQAGLLLCRRECVVRRLGGVGDRSSEGMDVCVVLKFDHSFNTNSFCVLLIMQLAT